MGDVTICDFGCSSVDGCSGRCQPPVRKASGKRCKWCEAGNQRHADGSHWIVKSFSPPTINIRNCAAVSQ